MKTREQKIESLIKDAFKNVGKYPEIQEAYDDLCEKYPENESDPDFFDQVVNDYFNSRDDIEIDSMYLYIGK